MRSTTTTRPATSLVTLGIDRLLEQDAGLIAGQRIGLVSNPASVDASFTHSADRLREWDNATLVALFGPQHGFRSNLQDNMIETPHGHDAAAACRSTRSTARRASRPQRCCATSTCWSSTCRMSAPASTPSSTRWPTACAPRRATACGWSSATARIPIGGDEVEGATAAPGVVVVRRTVPHSAAPRADDRRAGAALQRRVRHRLRARCRPDRRLAPRRCTSTKPACRGSSRRRTCRRSTAPIVYPGAVLFEGTMLSEGRGTTRPFELIGAPWIDGERLAEAMNAAGPARRALPRRCSSSRRSRSTRSRPAAAARSTSPTAAASSRYAPRRAARGVPPRGIRRASPGAQPPYEYEHEQAADRHPLRLGSAAAGDRRGGDVSSLIASWSADEERSGLRERYLLY